MRFKHRDGSLVHLAYCTNMHPAEDLDGIIAQLHTYAAQVRQQLGWPVLGVGLWLSADVAHQLATHAESLRRLKSVLADLHLEVVTLNGFPYSGFQNEQVKLDVYRPDWSERARFDYTVNLANVLNELLPADVEQGSISTLPLGWRTREVSSDLLSETADALQKLQQNSGRQIRLAIEPEPGCIVETMTHGIDVVQQIAPQWIGMCLDACHLSVQFESAPEVIQQANNAGVQIVKAQISNALRVPNPNDRAWLNSFIEPRFLHQARQQSGDGHLLSVDDLDENTAEILHEPGEWRIHFHVPLDMQDAENRTTQPELRRTLAALVGGEHPATYHFEVETYTWTVLPEAQRPSDKDGLVQGIAGELRWTFDQFTQLELEPVQ